MAQAPVIAVANDSERPEALGLVLRGLPARQRGPLLSSLAALVDASLAPFAALTVARAGRKIAAAAWVQPMPGRTACVWLPVAARGEPDEKVGKALLTSALARADAAGASVVQALIEPQDSASAALLQGCGFQRVTRLDYLEWAPSEGGPQESHDILFEPYSEAARPRLADVLEATYLQTLDCPELDGLRAISDVIDGYQQTPAFSPEFWFLIRKGDQDLGALLLAHHQAGRQVELVYMGLRPEARGQGLGRSLIARAQRVALGLRAAKLLLAVDARNDPARNAYLAAGFTVWAARDVHLRPGAPA